MALKQRDLVFASIVAAGAWALLAQWLPLLHVVPYAFLAGVLAALTFTFGVLTLTSRNASETSDDARLPTTTFVATLSPELWQQETASLLRRVSYQSPVIFSQAPLVSKDLDDLLHLALQDFVRTWYEKISSGSTFPNEVDRALRLAISGISSRVLKLDLVQLGVTRLLPIVNGHLRSFYEAERLVRGRNLTRDVTESDELDVAIAAKYEDGKLHPAASLAASKTTSLQQNHLRHLVAQILPHVLPEHMTTSPSALALIREIVACAVLLPLIQTLSDPDVLNQIVEAYGLSVLQERKTVRKLREALDEHAPPSSKSVKTSSLPRLVPSDTERHFEKFVRAIRQCHSLSDARRFRSEVARMLKRAAASTAPDHTFVRRLEVGKKLLDQQVERLSTRPTDRQSAAALPEQTLAQREHYSLRDVLLDAVGLSHFMEFMDRLNLMTLVQFWIVVDGFRGPLDYPHSSDAANGSKNQTRSWTDSDRQDLAQISEAYLWRPELNIPAQSQRAVHEFLNAGASAVWLQFDRARHAVLDAQEEVFYRMRDEHFAKFKKSDIYYKWLASEAGSATYTSSVSREWSPAELTSSFSLQNKPSLLPHAANKSILHDLRRVAASSSDLTIDSHRALQTKEERRSLDDAVSRRSFDDKRSRPPLFEGDIEDPLARSSNSLGSDSGSATRDETERNQTIAAVQAALDDLLDEEKGEESRIDGGDSLGDRPTTNVLHDTPTTASDKNISDIDKGRPSLASLGLLGTPSRRTVFSQGNLFGEDEESWQEGQSDSEIGKTRDDDAEIFEAAPGDLGLSEMIQNLSVDIDKLEAQQAVVDSLAKKAELTNNSAELRILKKSKLSLEREIHRKELQRQQYIVQESDNTLYGKATINIKSIMVGTEEDGHEYALYVIEVQRQQNLKVRESTNPDEKEEGNRDLVTWAIARRYSEFHELHRRLRSQYPSVRELEFPRRQMVLTLQKDFLKKRRLALEKYLRELLARPDICRSLEFRAFLSQQAIRPISDTTRKQVDKQDFITRIYNSVTDGMEEFLGNVPALDQLSVAGQNLISAASTDPTALVDSSTYPQRAIRHDVSSAAEAQAEITAFESAKDPEMVSFIKPVCDIFLELFQLNQGNNWLRGRAVVVVLQQLLGGTIERKVRESFKSFTTEESISKAMTQVKDILWPEGVWRGSPPARSEAEKSRSGQEAGLVLATLLPDLAGGVVGRSNAAKAGRRIFATMNNERLNQHLIYLILDECVTIVFGTQAVQSSSVSKNPVERDGARLNGR